MTTTQHTWRKDLVHAKHHYGPFTVTKLNNRKQTLVSWLVEHETRGVLRVESKFRDAKAWVEQQAAPLRERLCTPMTVGEAAMLVAL